MALIPTVANGAAIDAPTFGVPVANHLNQRHEHVAYVPGANIDATTTGVQTLWLTIGNVTVPAWATAAIITVCINDLTNITNSATYELTARIGTDVGRVIRHQHLGVAEAGALSWNDKLTLTSTGVKSLTIYAARTVGAGQFRVATTSDITVNVTYTG